MGQGCRKAQMKKREFYADGYYAGLAQEPRFARIIKIFRQLKGERLLDIGCGDGDITLLLKESSGAREVFGIDIASEAVAVAQRKGITAYKLDIDEEKFPFEEEYFDLIYCGELIEHLFNPDHLLKEIHRVLRTGGVCVITTPNLAGWPNRFALLLGYQPYPMAVSPSHEGIGKLLVDDSEGQWGHIRVFTAKAFQELLRLYHFKIRRLMGCPTMINSPLPPILGTIIKGMDRIMSRIPSLSTRLIATIEKV
ncbi:MAG: hypothetical protein CL873_02765 [Dehalococcoidales bacterium]|nr:hypothetical protein [Dehalococcoidales bacterium]